MLTLLFAAALAFPVPASSPVPVTAPVLGPPPSYQTGLHVASNGSIALAAWVDGRSESQQVTATRINADGTPLDPTGIVIQDNSTLKDVFWTGSAFAVVTLPNSSAPAFPTTVSSTSSDFMISYVGPDGTVTEATPLASRVMNYATHSDGPDAHVLLLPGDGFSRLALVVDLQGKTIHPGQTDGAYGYSWAASNGSGFLVVRALSGNGGTLLAETLDRDGNWGDSIDPQLPAGFSPAALTGDGHGGYAVFGFISSQKIFGVVRLDANGLAAPPLQVIQSYDPTMLRPAVTAATTANGFAASWTVKLANNHSLAYVSRNGGAAEQRAEWIGTASDASYDPVSDLLLVSVDNAATSTSFDVFVQKGSRQPVPLTYSAGDQAIPAIAAGSNGFLAAWTENTGTGSSLYVRRFAADATPQDQAQAADSTFPSNDNDPAYQNASVTSSGDKYLVAWDGAFARRLDARSGSWLDAAPFQLNAMASASNGSDALAITLEKCQQFPCTMVRRVAMSGYDVVSGGWKLSTVGSASVPVIASDGSNYLVVWNDGDTPYTTSRLSAMRLRADGTPIDAVPIVLAPAQAAFSVAWNGKTYLVTWTSGSLTISAAYVGSDGAVQQLGTIADVHKWVRSMKIVVHDGTFLIFSRNAPLNSYGFAPQELSVTSLDGSSRILDVPPSNSFSSFDAASDGLHLMLVYPRLDAEAGRVSRVVLQPYVLASRKRSVR